jgi:zinc protease
MVGSFDLDKVKPLVETYLATLPVGPVAESYQDLGIRPVQGVVKQEVHAGSEQKSFVSLIFTGPSTWSQLEADRFYMLVDILNIKIIDVLREKLSLIYGGGMGGTFERVPYGHYTIGGTLPCAPENVGKVVAATLVEIEKLQNERPQQDDIDKVKQNWRENDRISLRTNEHWLTRLDDAIVNHTDPSELLKLEKRIDTISASDLQQTAKRYFNLQNYVQMVLLPEKSPEKPTPELAGK